MNFACIGRLQEHWREQRGLELSLDVELCPDNMEGELTLNCFRLSKQFRCKPDLIAGEAAEFLRNDADVEFAEAVKGFVNFSLTPAALMRDTVMDDKKLVPERLIDEKDRRRILIEYSAPNTNKPLHLGHLRNNSLGMALVQILRRVGHEVIAVNLINDRGIHICKSMLAYMRWGDGQTPESTGIKGDHFVGNFYVRFAQEYKREVEALRKARPELKDKSDDELAGETELGQAAQSLLQAWEKGDPQVKELWRRMNQWVLEGFDQTYSRMGVKFDKVYYESETYQLGKRIVEEGLANGLFQKREDGAVIADLSDQKLGQKVLLRSDGTSVYITQDLGTTVLKAQEFTPEQMIWVVGDEQIHHFKILFALCQRLGYPWAGNLHHLAYGMVNLPHGRMKSREGTVVDADDLFDELHELARKEILARVSGEGPEDLEHRAEVIGMGALKFMLLKVNPKTTMKFDPDAAVKFEGDTGALVQYAYARIASIEKNATEEEVHHDVDWTLLTHEKERRLALMCGLYPRVLLKAASDLDTCALANYLVELARAFNSFYHECPVVKGNGLTPQLRAARLELCRRVRQILGDGLHALTIDTLEAM